MLQIIRTLINPIISRNLLILNLLSIVRYYLGYPRYLFSLKFKKEYIGGYLLSDQEAGRKRQKIIKKVVNKIDKNFIKVLEIGVYCGQTTLNISKELKKNKKDFEITCLDIWDEFENTTNTNSFTHNKLVEVLKNSSVYNLFLHNLKVNNILDKCRIIKKKSSDYLKTIDEKFDLIIIDGSHLYDEVISDLENSKKIIENKGFIIGDDYEVKYQDLSNIDLKELCKKRLDVFYDKHTKIRFHPGVTLAVFNIFGNINVINGLFCVQKDEKNYIDYSEKIK
tara:strand:- start:2908 stop:3747 length:840 start_codon:yes stop_codon:yes gene_type:complete